MAIEDFQAFQKQGKHPRDWHNTPREGRREGDAMKFVTAIGKQLPDFFWADAARLRISGIEPEVVPEDQAAGLSRGGVGTSEYTQQFGANIAANLRIENGGNGGVLQNQVEGLGWERQGLSICIGKA